MILYELRFFLIIKKKVQELRHSVVTGYLTMSIEKKCVHKGLINLSNYLLTSYTIFKIKSFVEHILIHKNTTIFIEPCFKKRN